jgi:peptidoglycan/xylan/chitin deacetylase (PgdA/CDA1 family)
MNSAIDFSILGKLVKNSAFILTLHRVAEIDNHRIWKNEHLKISPLFLEKLILSLKRRSVSFISIDELYEILLKQRSAKNCIVFTLDDGYRDNYENAYPLFKLYNVPFIIYVVTKMVEKKFIYWWYLLEDLIIRNDQICLRDGSIIKCDSGKKKEAAFLRIRDRILSLHPLKLREELPWMFDGYQLDLDSYNDVLPLTWEHIETLGKEPLATIGSHSHSHIGFKYCELAEIKKDIQQSITLLESHVHRKVMHFCFPYGEQPTLRHEERNLISSLGFKTAVTSHWGPIYASHSSQLYSLPRFFLTERSGFQLCKISIKQFLHHQLWSTNENITC